MSYIADLNTICIVLYCIIADLCRDLVGEYYDGRQVVYFV